MELESRRELRRPKRNVGIWFLTTLLILFMLASLGLGGYYYLEYMESQPSLEIATPYEGIAQPFWFNGQLYTEDSYHLENDQIYLSFDFIKEQIDPYIFWDESIKNVIITTEDKVLRVANQQLEAYLNEAPFQLSFPVIQHAEQIYLPIDLLVKFYPIEYKFYPEYKVLEVSKSGQAYQTGIVIPVNAEDQETKPIRAEASIKEPIYEQLKLEATVQILGEKNGWYFVLSEQGISGYMQKEHVRLGGITLLTQEVPEKTHIPWKPLGAKLNLTWEHVVSKNPDTSKIPELKGLNVISPTWFEIGDEEGNIINNADLNYVKWAHERGYQVWALISNGFKLDRTHAFLSSYEARQKIIRQMIEFAHLYDLDGYNIDFENVYLKDKELLVQFVRELTPYLHEQGLVVSIDVTTKSTSETWSMFYDRKALGEVVDYMMVMAYDQTPAGSKTAGSVSTLSWTENGIRGILEDVPAHKVVLGVPFYTRLWTETKDKNGNITVSQKAYFMDSIKNWLKERSVTPVFDEKSGQYYAEYFDQKDGLTYKVWLEDETSMRARAELVNKYNLAGIASWRRGFESQEIWQVIDDVLSQRP